MMEINLMIRVFDVNQRLYANIISEMQAEEVEKIIICKQYDEGIIGKQKTTIIICNRINATTLATNSIRCRKNKTFKSSKIIK